MLSTPTPFPQAGSYAYLDDHLPDGRDTIEQVRILQDKGQGLALVSLTGRRYPREIASGNRTVPFAALRETEQPLPQPSGRTAPAHPELAEGSRRKPKAQRAAKARGKVEERRS